MSPEEWVAWVERDPAEAARVLWLAERHGGIQLHDRHIWAGAAAIGALK